MRDAATLVRGQGGDAMALVLRVSARRLAGAASIHEGVLAPDELVPPHTHTREDQCLYVVSGRVIVEVGNELVDAPAGSFVIKPMGLPHAFWNPAPSPAHVLEITSPGGFESFYDEMSAVAGPNEAVAVGNRYAMAFHHDRIAAVRARFASYVGERAGADAPSADSRDEYVPE